MRRISYFLLFSFICYQSPLIAGDSFDKNNSQFGLWTNLGIGKSYFGPTFQGDISLAISNNLVLIGFLKADEFRFSPVGTSIKTLRFISGNFQFYMEDIGKKKFYYIVF